MEVGRGVSAPRCPNPLAVALKAASLYKLDEDTLAKMAVTSAVAGDDYTALAAAAALYARMRCRGRAEGVYDCVADALVSILYAAGQNEAYMLLREIISRFYERRG